MVHPPLADPVSLAFLGFLFPLFFGLLLHLFLSRGQHHVLWLSFDVIDGFGLLAAVAVLSALEVVILALRTLPTAVWETEVLGLINWLFLGHKGLDRHWREIGHFGLLIAVQCSKQLVTEKAATDLLIEGFV